MAERQGSRHTVTQSTVQTGSRVALGQVRPEDVVLISEYTGGGFGSKSTGTISSMIPALLSKKANAPVMMRIAAKKSTTSAARGRRPGRMKVGFAKDGRIMALDMFAVSDNGPYEPQGDCNIAGASSRCCISRWRCASAAFGPHQHAAAAPAAAPGGTQSHMVMEPLIAKAANELEIDQWRFTASTRRRQGEVRSA